MAQTKYHSKIASRSVPGSITSLTFLTPWGRHSRASAALQLKSLLLIWLPKYLFVKFISFVSKKSLIHNVMLMQSHVPLFSGKLI